jgi:hypothetical protein
MRTPLTRAIVFYVTMVCLLIPIGYFAFWGAKYARPNFGSSWLIKDGSRQLVIGNNNSSARFFPYYCSDLETGATTAKLLGLRHSVLKGNGIGTKVWLIGETSKNQYATQFADLANDDGPVLHKLDTAKKSELDGMMGMIENRILRVRSGQLELFDLDSVSTIDSIPLPIQSFSFIDSIYNTNRFLLVSNADPTSKLRDVHLMEVTDGRFRRISNWSDLHCLNQSIGDAHYMTSLMADGSSIEVRNASNGEIVAKYPVPQAPSLVLPMASLDVSNWQKSWLQWRRIPTLPVDILTGQTLPIPVGSELIEQDFVNNRLITMREKTNKASGWDCVLLDKTSGEELSRFDVARENYISNSALGGAFLDDANRLVLTTRHCRILVYDLTSGALVRNIDPFFWPEWCMRCVIVAFALWCLVWLLVSVKIHPYGWLDFGVCSGLLIAFYANLDYTDFFVSVGVFAAWVLASVVWLLFGTTRWSLRFQPLLLLFGVTSGIMNVLPIDGNEKVVPFVLGGIFVLTVIYLAVLTPLRWFRFRLESKRSAEPLLKGAAKNNLQSIALRDLFCLTIVFAFLFSIFRLIPSFGWDAIKMRDWIAICILVAWIAGASLLAMWVGFSQRSWKLRWGIALAVVIGFDVSIAIASGSLFPAELTYSAFLATLFGFYAYRLRGWRLTR